MNEIPEPPKAACVLAFDHSGRVLAATRRGNANEWGMVGGKVDEGESPLACALREFEEETGIILRAEPRHLVSRLDAQGYLCFVYVVDDPMDLDTIRGAYDYRRAVPREDFFVTFVNYGKLLEGPYGGFNEMILGFLLSLLSIHLTVPKLQ